MAQEEMNPALHTLLTDPLKFCEVVGGVRLRRYQEEVALAIIDSVVKHRGHSFVIMFPRQSGKNELQAQIEAYLLTMLSQFGEAEIIKASPTYLPQTANAMRRLERVLTHTDLLKNLWFKEAGHTYRVQRARITFLSAAPAANVVGATARTLLECDEAQDVLIEKWDKDFAPMAASTNATRAFWGTAWTGSTLLARELRSARDAEKIDGVRRAFVLTADDVAREVPAYGAFVAGQVQRLGRDHPLVKTQYYAEEIDQQGGMFPPERMAWMRGCHPSETAPLPGAIYALLLDVAGEDEDGSEDLLRSSPPRRDSTALTVVRVDLSTLADDVLRAPTYCVVQRRLWTGVKHTRLYSEIRALALHWRARWLVADATGVGAGLCSFLSRALPGKVIPVTFNSAVKSEIGWSFLGLVDAGRYREYAPEDPLQALFWRQCTGCAYETRPGPGKLLRWGVSDSARDPGGEGLLHDDLLLSAALCTQLDRQAWSAAGGTLIIPAPDPLNSMVEF